MSYTITKNIFRVIAFLISFAVILLLVNIYGEISDISLNDFESIDQPFNLTKFLEKLWPKQILIAFAILVILAAFISDRSEKLIGKISISGNILIPILFLIYVLVVVGYILAANITYPSTMADERLFPIILLASGSLILIPLFFGINDSLRKPSSTTAFLIILVSLFGSSYLALLTWLNYIGSGEIDIIHVIKQYLEP